MIMIDHPSYVRTALASLANLTQFHVKLAALLAYLYMAVDDKVSCMTQKFQFHKALLVSKPKDATGHHACHLYGNMNKSFHLHYLLLSIKPSNRAHNTYILLVLHSTNVVKWMLYAIDIWNKILKIFRRRCNWLENVNTNLFLYV
jgi:hypothetical protein